jgi:GTP-binding protein
VVVLVLAADEGLTTQDKKLVAFLDRRKRPSWWPLTKLDLVPRSETKAVKETFRRELKIAAQAPIIFTSTLTRTGLSQILPLAETIDARVPDTRHHRRAEPGHAQGARQAPAAGRQLQAGQVSTT